MARRTFADFDTELNIALGKRQDFTPTIRDFILTQGYFYVANAIRHREIETDVSPTLLANTDSVSVAADFWFPELVFNVTDGRPVNPGDFRQNEAVPKQTGPPSEYSVWASSLLFDRKPSVNTTIKIFYVKKPAAPSAGANSVLDELYDQLILMYSIKFAFEQLRDFEQAAKMMTAINVYAGQLKVPWRMARSEDRDRRIQLRMR